MTWPIPGKAVLNQTAVPGDETLASTGFTSFTRRSVLTGQRLSGPMQF